jgi:hypothetical protein
VRGIAKAGVNTFTKGLKIIAQTQMPVRLKAAEKVGNRPKNTPVLFFLKYC